MKKPYYVTTYEESRTYGGPEEGGWYYSVVEYAGHQRCKTRKSAIAERDRQYQDMQVGFFLAVESRSKLGSRDNTEQPRPRYE